MLSKQTKKETWFIQPVPELEVWTCSSKSHTNLHSQLRYILIVGATSFVPSMRGITGLKRNPILFLLAGLSLSNVLAGNVLSSSGFTNCENNATITVNNANVEFDRSSLTVIFDVSGTSSAQQKVIADLTVSAYGNQVYQKTFNPCDAATFVGQLCPGRRPRFSYYTEDVS